MRLVNKNLIKVMLCISLFYIISGAQQAPPGQKIRWLSIGSLRTWISSDGAEIEEGYASSAPTLQTYQIFGLKYPQQFPFGNHGVAKALKIGTTNYFDKVTKIRYPAKVVAIGPFQANTAEILPDRSSFKMIGRFYAPNVKVDGVLASNPNSDDAVDEIDPNLPCDRMVVSRLTTPIGISITRKVMQFSQQYNDNYIVNDYTFKNTDTATLTGVYFLFQFRYGNGEEGYRQSPNQPAQGIGWGKNSVYKVVGSDPTASGFEFRGFYSCMAGVSASPYFPHDLGLPANWGDGHLTAGNYMGVVTLHADKSTQDHSDDPFQPKSTPFVGSDNQNSPGSTEDAPRDNDQYNASIMSREYTLMSKGHYTQDQADLIGNGPVDTWSSDASVSSNPGGYSQTLSYGPYTMAPGDSIHIAYAEGCSGLNQEKCYEVGSRWAAAKGIPGGHAGAFTLPNGTVASNEDIYKDTWLSTCVDSVKQMFRRAITNYNSGLNIPQPPPPPGTFLVNTGGDRISLSWTNDAETAPGFAGYDIYRAVNTTDTFYTKINVSTLPPGTLSFNDTTAQRGLSYFYYIVSKDNGSRNTVEPGVPLVSSKYFTRTNAPAQLQRPAPPVAAIDTTIRIVPNPFDKRAIALQFGGVSTHDPDKIGFLGLPGDCVIKIYTERGDLIKTIQHHTGRGDEYWDSTTDYRQFIVSGVYIAVFTTPSGKSVIRKFIVIR